jgi:hypothetical protein
MAAGKQVGAIRLGALLTWLSGGVASVFLFSGCGDGFLQFDWFTEQQKTVPDESLAGETIPFEESAAFKGTLAEKSWFDGTAPLRVRGFGVVMGLGKNGSTRCPTETRRRLVQDMYRLHREQFSRSESGISPEALIADPDTAVVEVEGLIPPGARKGSTFDISVSALPGTETKTLVGGRLLFCELERFRAVNETTALRGKRMAVAAGPVFTNPFKNDDQGELVSSTRVGVVMGGGRTLSDRPVALVVTPPSYQVARSIEERINARFDGPDKIGDAVSPTLVSVIVPSNYKDRPAHFLHVLRHLSLGGGRAAIDRQIAALAKEMVANDPPFDELRLALEAVGRDAVPTVKKLYTHSDDDVSYHAAIAGLRLEDELAVEVIGAHAENRGSPYRLEAIRELGFAKNVRRGAYPLRRLLNEEDPRIQVAAYESLVMRNDYSLDSVRVGRDNFILDVVRTKNPGCVYAKRYGQQRIALFGEGMSCRPPLFLALPDDSLTINANERDRRLKVIRRTPTRSAASPAVAAPFEISGLLDLLGSDAEVTDQGKVQGLGVDYSRVVRTLAELCETGDLPARFVLERPTTIDIFGPLPGAERPESSTVQ